MACHLVKSKENRFVAPAGSLERELCLVRLFRRVPADFPQSKSSSTSFIRISLIGAEEAVRTTCAAPKESPYLPGTMDSRLGAWGIASPGRPPGPEGASRP